VLPVSVPPNLFFFCLTTISQPMLFLDGAHALALSAASNSNVLLTASPSHFPACPQLKCFWPFWWLAHLFFSVLFCSVLSCTRACTEPLIPPSIFHCNCKLARLHCTAVSYDSYANQKLDRQPFLHAAHMCCACAVRRNVNVGVRR
jgi:hypothetical protein